MAKKILQARLKQGENLFNAIKTSLVNNQGLATITGNESYLEFTKAMDSFAGQEGLSLKNALSVLKPGSLDAFLGAKGRNGNPIEIADMYKDAEQGLKSIQGLEGFSMQNFKGSSQDLKAANMALNAQSHLQTPAAEAMFSSISVKYEDEGAELKVRAAGLGTYAYGNAAWQSSSDLQPIFGLLRTGEMYKEEVLDIFPVWPEADDDETREYFASASLITPTDVTYMNGDAYGRQAHKTQFLAVPTFIPNFLALTEAPGQRPWTATDEIESNSIVARAIGVSAKVGNSAVSFFVQTSAMTNNTFTATNNGQSSDDRMLVMPLRGYPGFSVTNKDGLEIGETLFASFKTAGYEPMLSIELGGNFQRQKNELRLNAGSARVDALRDIALDKVIPMGRMSAEQRALCKTLNGGSVVAMKVTANVSNTSRGNFGYRIEVFDTIKHLSVQRRSPISVKYPIAKEDTNQDSLDFAIESMSIVINNQCSRTAFDVAEEHLKYITTINGSPVIANEQGPNVLAGQHYVRASAINRGFKLRDVVSSVDSSGVFDAVCAAVTNELSDITCALTTNSGLAAIAEYGGTNGELEWTVVVHQNLSRFIMRPGDARTIGATTKLNVVETNFDSQIGRFLIMPKNTSSNDTINPLGGIGVCVTKENILVQGNVTRDQQEFGVVMTLPVYKHWPMNPILGSLVIEDARDFLGNEGLLTKLAAQRVVVDNIGDAGANVTTPVDPNA